MTKEIIINKLPGNIIYIENMFPKANEFIKQIESLDDNLLINNVIPSWSKWIDGGPVRVDDENGTSWLQVFPETEDAYRGQSKSIDWDQSINNQNSLWPRLVATPDTSEGHKLAYPVIKLIEDDYISALKIWSSQTGNDFPNYVTRNYCIRKYRTSGLMGSHIDRNTENPNNTMDWTALIYLNDNYSGGELVFDNLNIELKPKAGSIVFLPCLEYHSVKEVIEGNKYYIFLFLHTDYGSSTALGEPYNKLNDDIKNNKKLVSIK